MSVSAADWCTAAMARLVEEHSAAMRKMQDAYDASGGFGRIAIFKEKIDGGWVWRGYRRKGGNG